MADASSNAPEPAAVAVAAAGDSMPPSKLGWLQAAGASIASKLKKPPTAPAVPTSSVSPLHTAGVIKPSLPVDVPTGTVVAAPSAKAAPAIVVPDLGSQPSGYSSALNRLHSTWMTTAPSALTPSYRVFLAALVFYCVIGLGIQVSANAPHYHAALGVHALILLLIAPSPGHLSIVRTCAFWVLLADIAQLIMRRTNDGIFGPFVLMSKSIQLTESTMGLMVFLGAWAVVSLPSVVSAAQSGFAGSSSNSDQVSKPSPTSIGTDGDYHSALSAVRSEEADQGIGSGDTHMSGAITVRGFFKALLKKGPMVILKCARHMAKAAMRKKDGDSSSKSGSESRCDSQSLMSTGLSQQLFILSSIAECVGTIPMYNSALAMLALLAVFTRSRMVLIPAICLLVGSICADYAYLQMGADYWVKAADSQHVVDLPSYNGFVYFQIITTLILAIVKIALTGRLVMLQQRLKAAFKSYPAGGTLDRRGADAAMHHASPAGLRIREILVLIIATLSAAAAVAAGCLTGPAWGDLHSLAALNVIGRKQSGVYASAYWGGSSSLFYGPTSWLGYRAAEDEPEVSMLSAPHTAVAVLALVAATLASRGRMLSLVLLLVVMYTFVLDLAWLISYSKGLTSPVVGPGKDGQHGYNDWLLATGLSLGDWTMRGQALVALVTISALLKLPLLITIAEWARVHLVQIPITYQQAVKALSDTAAAADAARSSTGIEDGQAEPSAFDGLKPVPAAAAAGEANIYGDVAVSRPGTPANVSDGASSGDPTGALKPAPAAGEPTAAATSAPDASTPKPVETVIVITNPTWKHGDSNSRVSGAGVLPSPRSKRPSDASGAAATEAALSELATSNGWLLSDPSVIIGLLTLRWAMPMLWTWRTLTYSSGSGSAPYRSSSTGGIPTSSTWQSKSGTASSGPITCTALFAGCGDSMRSCFGMSGAGRPGGSKDAGFIMVFEGPGRQATWVRLAEPALMLPDPSNAALTSAASNPMRDGAALSSTNPMRVSRINSKGLNIDINNLEQLPQPPAGMHYIQVRTSLNEPPRFMLIKVMGELDAAGTASGSTSPRSPRSRKSKQHQDEDMDATPTAALTRAQLARLASLPDAASMATLADDIKEREEKLRTLQAQLASESTNSERHHSLMNEYESLSSAVKEQKVKAEIDAQRTKVNADDVLSDYASLLSLRLNGAILACITINSGMVSGTRGDKKGDKAADVLDALNSSVGSAVPGAGLVLSLLSKAAAFHGEWERKKAVQRVATAFKGAASAEAVAEALSRHLALSFENALHQLQEQDDVEAGAIASNASFKRSKAGWMKAQLQKMKELKRIVEVSDVTGRVTGLADEHASTVLEALMAGHLDALIEKNAAEAGSSAAGSGWDTNKPETCAAVLARLIAGYDASAAATGSAVALRKGADAGATPAADSSQARAAGGSSSSSSSSAQNPLSPASQPQAAKAAATSSDGSLVSRIELVAGQVARLESAISVQRDERAAALSSAQDENKAMASQLQQLIAQVKDSSTATTTIISDVKALQDGSAALFANLQQKEAEAASAQALASQKALAAEKAASDARIALDAALLQVASAREVAIAEAKGAATAASDAVKRVAETEARVKTLVEESNAAAAFAKAARSDADLFKTALANVTKEAEAMRTTYAKTMETAIKQVESSAATAAQASSMATAAAKESSGIAASFQKLSMDNEANHKSAMQQIASTMEVIAAENAARSKQAAEAAAASQAALAALQTRLEAAIADADKQRKADTQASKDAAAAAEARVQELMRSIDAMRQKASSDAAEAMGAIAREKNTLAELTSLLRTTENARSKADAQSSAWMSGIDSKLAASATKVEQLLTSIETTPFTSAPAGGAVVQKVQLERAQMRQLTSALHGSLAAVQDLTKIQESRMKEIDRTIADLAADRAAVREVLTRLQQQQGATGAVVSGVASSASGAAKKRGWFGKSK